MTEENQNGGDNSAMVQNNPKPDVVSQFKQKLLEKMNSPHLPKTTENEKIIKPNLRPEGFSALGDLVREENEKIKEAEATAPIEE